MCAFAFLQPKLVRESMLAFRDLQPIEELVVVCSRFLPSSKKKVVWLSCSNKQISLWVGGRSNFKNGVPVNVPVGELFNWREKLNTFTKEKTRLTRDGVGHELVWINKDESKHLIVLNPAKGSDFQKFLGWIDGLISQIGPIEPARLDDD